MARRKTSPAPALAPNPAGTAPFLGGVALVVVFLLSCALLAVLDANPATSPLPANLVGLAVLSGVAAAGRLTPRAVVLGTVLGVVLAFFLVNGGGSPDLARLMLAVGSPLADMLQGAPEGGR